MVRNNPILLGNATLVFLPTGGRLRRKQFDGTNLIALGNTTLCLFFVTIGRDGPLGIAHFVTAAWTDG